MDVLSARSPRQDAKACKMGFEPLPEGFAQVESRQYRSSRKAISSRTAAVMLEAVQGEGGVDCHCLPIICAVSNNYAAREEFF